MTKFRLLILALIITAAFGCNADNKPAKQSNDAAPQKPPTASKKVYDGPFGLAMGITQTELISMGFKQDEEQSWIFTGTPPGASDLFSHYSVASTKQGGLFVIIAATDDFTVNGSGEQVKSKVTEIADLLSQKYGKYSFKVNSANDDMFIRNPDMWFIGLKDKSVKYAYIWQAGHKGTTLPNEIIYIHVEALANRDSSGYARVKYNFSNEDSCLKEIKSIKSSKL
jgi:hypothetical protein